MHRVVKGIDVFEVGKEQVWRWCGWRDFGNCEPTMYNNVFSLRKGAYLVVGNQAKFGAMAHKPYVWEDCTSLKTAVELVECFYESDFERCEMNLCSHIVDDYEIWHVVDDENLWQGWSARVDLAARMAVHDEILRDGNVEVHEYENAYAWFVPTRCYFLELCVYDSAGTFRAYYRMHRDKYADVLSVMETLTQMYLSEDGEYLPWKLVLCKYVYPDKSLDCRVVNEYWPVSDNNVCPF